MARCYECGVSCDLKEELGIKSKKQSYCFCSLKCMKMFEKERLEGAEKEAREERAGQAMNAEAFDEEE